MGKKKVILAQPNKKMPSPDSDDFTAEKIIDKRLIGSNVQYLIKWQGFLEKDNTWQPLRHLTNLQEMIDKFQNKAKRAQKIKKAQRPQPKKVENPTSKLRSQKQQPTQRITRNRKDREVDKKGQKNQKEGFIITIPAIKDPIIIQQDSQQVPQPLSIADILNAEYSNVAQPNDTAELISYDGKECDSSQSPNQSVIQLTIESKRKQRQIQAQGLLVQSPIKIQTQNKVQKEKQMPTTAKKPNEESVIEEEFKQISMNQSMIVEEEEVKQSYNQQVQAIESKVEIYFESQKEVEIQQDPNPKINFDKISELINSCQDLGTRHPEIQPAGSFLFPSNNEPPAVAQCNQSVNNSKKKQQLLQSSRESSTQTDPLIQVKLLPEDDPLFSSLFDSQTQHQSAVFQSGYCAPPGQLNIEEYVRECQQVLEDGGTIISFENLLVNIQLKDKNKKTSSNHLVRFESIRNHSEEIMMQLLKLLLKFK